MSLPQRNNRGSNRVVDLRNRPSAVARRPTPSPARPPRIEREGQGSRVSPLRTRRRRIRAVWLGIFAVVILALAIGVHYASYSERVTIQSVEVRGTHAVSSQEVHDLVVGDLSTQGFRYIAPDNIFTLPHRKIEAQIMNTYPRVKSVIVARDPFLSTTLIVSIVERSPFAKWCDGLGVCYVLDESGYLYTDAATLTDLPANAYTFLGGVASSSDPLGQTFAPGHLPGIIALLKYLGNDDHPALGATISDDQDFIVQLQAGYILKASFGQDASLLVKNLDLVLQSDALQGKEADLEYIDLRFGNRVYYKLKGGDQTPAQ